MELEFKHKQSFKGLFAKLKTGKRKRNKSMNLQEIRWYTEWVADLQLLSLEETKTQVRTVLT